MDAVCQSSSSEFAQGHSLFEDTEHGEKAGSVPGVVPEGASDILVPRQAKHRDNCISNGGKVLRTVPAVDLASVFLEGYVANVVRAVLDAPMSAPKIK